MTGRLWTPGSPRIWTPPFPPPRRPFGPEWGDEPYDWPIPEPRYCGFLQAKTGTGTGDPATVAFTSAVTAGSLLVCTVQCINTGAVTVSDNHNAGNWTNAVNHSTTNNANDLGAWYFPNSTGASITVTVAGQGSANTGITIYEFAGALTSSPLDKTTANDATGTTITSTSQTPVGTNGDIVVSALSSQTQNVTYSNSTSGWTVEANNTPNATMSAAIADFTWASGAVTTTWGVSGGSQDLSVITVSFKLVAVASRALPIVEHQQAVNRASFF